ncbi:hypothetical protein BgAZ_104650 [Babesia gibsoni]|uniref:Uncharacterized protein n=1 Tax=Babesia gibsoni TaxID=33632 RepID=A0AAD8PFX0_BABGI|nr:hypothetical protein BgAZ_104650 [Babesia gibsoni]
MKSRKRDCNINGRGIRRGSEAAMVKHENFYFREFDDTALPFGVRRISCVAESKPRLRPNLYVSSNIIGRLDTFVGIFANDPLLSLNSKIFLKGKDLTEESIKENAGKIWTVQPGSHITFDELSSEKVETQNTLHLNFQKSRSPSPKPESPMKLSQLLNDKKTPVTYLKSLTGRVKQIFRSAIVGCTVQYIKPEELNIDGTQDNTNGDFQVSTPKEPKTPSVPATESDGSQKSISSDNSRCRPSNTRFHKSTTDHSGPDDINDAVSMSVSPIDEQYQLYFKDNGYNSGNERDKHDADNEGADRIATDMMMLSMSNSSLGDYTSFNATQYEVEDLMYNIEKTNKNTEALRNAVTAHVEASKKEDPHSISHYNFYRVRPDLYKAVHGDSPSESSGNDPDESPQSPTAVKRDIATYAVSPLSDSKESTNISLGSTKSSEPVKLKTASETLGIKSSRFIKEVIKVTPSSTVKLLKNAGIYRNDKEPQKLLLDSSWESGNGDEFKPVNRALGRRHPIELQRNETHDIFVEEWNEKRKVKYLQGIQIPSRKHDTNTKLCFGDEPPIAIPKVRPSTSTTDISSKHMDGKNAEGILHRETTIDEGLTQSSGETHQVMLTEDVINRKAMEEGYGTTSSRRRSLGRDEGDEFYHDEEESLPSDHLPRRRGSHRRPASAGSLSDTNTVDSYIVRSSRNSKGSTYRRNEDVDTASRYPRRTRINDDIDSEMGIKRSKAHDSHVSGHGGSSKYDNPEPYSKVSQTEDDIIHLAHEKRGKYESSNRYSSKSSYVELAAGGLGDIHNAGDI